MLVNFTEADPNEPGRAAIIEEVHSYNRRFSGEPRPVSAISIDFGECYGKFQQGYSRFR